MKLAVCGPGSSGKGLTSQYLFAHTTLRPGKSTSQVICPRMAAKLGVSEESAYADRHNHREEWADEGDAMREGDDACLARDAGGDVIDGIRRWEEFDAAFSEGLFDLSIWIERDVPEDTTITYGSDRCDVIIDNNGTKGDLYRKLRRLSRSLGILK